MAGKEDHLYEVARTNLLHVMRVMEYEQINQSIYQVPIFKKRVTQTLYKCYN